MSDVNARCALLAVLIGAFAGVAACGGEASTDPAQSEDDATSFTAPAEGSCEAKAMLEVANGATLAALDDDAKLTRAAAEAIVAARPLATIAALDAVAQVGPSALNAILKFADASACRAGSSELGIISDLDDTVVPKATPDLSLAPFPGVKALYHLIDERQGGKTGDVYYVTARSPDRAKDIPAYLAKHGVPSGAIETGTSGAPFIARPEKVRDMEGIFARTGTQRFVFFGDTANVDPEVQRDILAKHPERMAAGIIHKVTATVAPERVAGLHLVNDYAEAAAVLFKLGTITKAEALGVMQAARDEGLDITTKRMNELLAAP
jgi:hypothetical protein